MKADPIRAATNRGVGIGMVIAAAMVAEWDDTRATEILHACGLTTFRAMREAGVDTYDIYKLRFVIQQIAERARCRLDRLNRGFGPIDDLAVAA